MRFDHIPRHLPFPKRDASAFNKFLISSLKADSKDMLYILLLFSATLLMASEPLKIDPVRSQTLYEEGLAIQKKGDIKTAIEKWEQALELNPKNVSCLNHYAWHLSVVVEGKDKNLPKALEMSLKAVEASEGKHLDSLDTLAEIYFRMKQGSKAVETMRKALAQDTSGLSKKKQKYYADQLTKFEVLEAEQKQSSQPL
jgi:Tfp pilus assembly protein PilF